MLDVQQVQLSPEDEKKGLKFKKDLVDQINFVMYSHRNFLMNTPGGHWSTVVSTLATILVDVHLQACTPEYKHQAGDALLEVVKNTIQFRNEHDARKNTTTLEA